jgi:type II secretory pathway component GspD/PulD (secretin)
LGGGGLNPRSDPSKSSDPNVNTPGSGVGNSNTNKSDIRVYVLKHVAAEEMGKTLGELFQGSMTRIVSTHANSLVVQTDASTHETLKNLIEKLDVENPKRPK